MSYFFTGLAGYGTRRISGYEDGFNCPDGPLGGAWTVQSGAWAIVNNQAKCTAIGNVTVPCAVNVNLSVRVTVSGTMAASLICRYVDENNYIRLVISSNGTVTFAKVIGGTPVAVWNGAFTYVAGEKLGLVMNQTIAKLYYQDVLLVTADPITNAVLQTSAVCGLRNGTAANAVFDDFLAKNL